MTRFEQGLLMGCRWGSKPYFGIGRQYFSYLSRRVLDDDLSKNRYKSSFRLAGMARQLLPEGSWRKSVFLIYRENFISTDWSKSLGIDNSHGWKLKIITSGHLATLKWLVNCILKASGGIIGFHCILKPRLTCWSPSSLKCSENGRPCIS